MFITSTPDDDLIPHRENIRTIIDSHPVLSKLKKNEKVLIAGGFAQALLLAPRNRARGDIIDPAYYTDIDIFVTDTDVAEALRWNIRGMLGPYICKTASAVTFNFTHCHRVTKLQIITASEKLGTPKEVLSKFDFKNCAIAYHPYTETFYIHKDAVKCHLNKELEFNNLSALESDETLPIAREILRLDKYCTRWGYTLSESALVSVMKFYNKHPKIIFQETMSELKEYDGPVQTPEDMPVNMWLLIADIITECPYYNPSMDEHGYINKRIDEPKGAELWSETKSAPIKWSKIDTISG